MTNATPGPYIYETDGTILSTSGAIVATLPAPEACGIESVDREAVETMNADGDLLAASWELLDVLSRLVGGNGREGDLFDGVALSTARKLVDRLSAKK